MFALKHSFWIDLVLEFTPKKLQFYKRSHEQLCDAVYGTSHSFMWYLQTVIDCRTTLNEIQKAVMWLVIKAHVIQVSRYAFSNGRATDTLISPNNKTISGGDLKPFSCAQFEDNLRFINFTITSGREAYKVFGRTFLGYAHLRNYHKIKCRMVSMQHL